MFARIVNNPAALKSPTEINLKSEVLKKWGMLGRYKKIKDGAKDEHFERDLLQKVCEDLGGSEDCVQIFPGQHTLHACIAISKYVAELLCCFVFFFGFCC